jgi:hypothetical protein
MIYLQTQFLRNMIDSPVMLSPKVVFTVASSGNTEEKASVSAILELAQEYFLQQLVTEPTQKEHILDLVFTSNDTIVKNVKIS